MRAQTAHLIDQLLSASGTELTSYALPAIYECPACHKLLLRSRLRSFHTFGVTYWSDGDATFARLPSRSPLVRCPHCPTVFWEEDAQPIGQLPLRPMHQEPMGWFLRLLVRWSGDDHGDLKAERDWNSAPAEWRDAPHDDKLEFADLELALADLTYPHDQRELFIRRRIWWLAGDFARAYPSGQRAAVQSVVPEDVAEANIFRLLELVEHDPRAQVTHGEILRQLGRFDEAVAVLKAVQPNGHSEVKASKIQRLAMGKDSRLQPL